MLPFNNNIRCIEIAVEVLNSILISMFNNNIRCIEIIKKDEEFSDSYAICLAMEVSKFLDIEFDHDNLQRLYITAVNTLRLEFL